jgi:hypothetical protein
MPSRLPPIRATGVRLAKSDQIPAMLTVSIWNQITTEFFGRSVYGSYVI